MKKVILLPIFTTCLTIGIITNAIGKKLRELGDDAETIWIADDHDPLRKVPFPLPEDYEKYLGMPYSTIPCPDGCCSNFVEHFEKLFLRVMKDYKIDIKTKSGLSFRENGSLKIMNPA